MGCWSKTHKAETTNGSQFSSSLATQHVGEEKQTTNNNNTRSIGELCAQASAQCGLPKGIPVVPAATDGIADLVASGARRPGDANTTLGTTIVWKALCLARPAASPGIYSHRHPGGWWAPGAAGNSGPGSLTWAGDPLPPAERDRCAGRYFPTPVLAYPLRAAGERFPFHSAEAREFMEGCPANEFERYAAQLQALALIERWGYERLNASGIDTGGTTWSGGRASASETLAQLRATVLGRPVCRSAHPEAAFGAAILTAAAVFHRGDVAAAIRAMTRAEAVIDRSVTVLPPSNDTVAVAVALFPVIALVGIEASLIDAFSNTI